MNLPSDFIERTKPLLKENWESLLSALSEDIPVSIHLNKNKLKEINTELSNNVPWCDLGYYLPQRPSFTFEPLFHAGCYYVQEASSMFLYQVFKQYVVGDLHILDLCAAPGGKSTLIADIMGDNSLLVSNEVIRSRANILSENLSKWGNPNVVVTNNDPSAFGKLKHYFDVILIDAPCSGEGMFRKDKGAVDEWSVDNVKLCAERQRRIIADAWDSLKPNGLLIYSTCTYNIEEDEDNVQWIIDHLGAEILLINVAEQWGISPSVKGDIPVYRFFPHKIKGEGFFLAALRKSDAEIHILKSKKEKRNTKNNSDLPKEIKNCLSSPDSSYFYQKGNHWHAAHQIFKEDICLLESTLNVISSGVCIGEMKGANFIPAQSLAMSCLLNKSAFVNIEVDWKTAVSYLKRESLVFSDLPKGYILLTYKKIPIGFVKNIGNRANNLYPPEWRIRSNHLPDSEVTVL